MSVFWLAPAVLLGLALVVVPIAIHLLVRQQGRRLDYPSLRFLRSSQLAAFRRRSIQDALLLMCRVVVIATAVMALAGPVLQTRARSAGYSSRVARAVIVEPGAESSAADAVGDAFVSQSFSRAEVADAIADATRWLSEQPPAAREIVFVGAFRRGSLTPADLAAVQAPVGVRFVPAPAVEPPRDLALPVLRARTGTLVIERQQVRLTDDETRVSGGAATSMAAGAVRVVAAPADQALADAALRAVLATGLRWSDAATPVLVVWNGADEALVQRSLNGATAIRMDRPIPVSAAATLVRDAIERVTATPTDALEPIKISAEYLQSWSRLPGPAPADGNPVDEGDRRWLWGLALVLLTAEYALRRTARSQAVIEPIAEARVA